MSGCLDDQQSSNRLVIGISEDISGYYPFMSRDSISCSVNQNFFNPLVEIDNQTTGIIPALAESWSNPDNVTWRFYLRKNVRFHDGSLFTADDVNFTLDFLKNFSFYKERLSTIEKIIIIDDYTIDISTNRFSPLFLYDMINVNILCRTYVDSVETIEDYLPVGTGPYELVEHVVGESISIKRFESYWKGVPDIEEAVFRVDSDYDKRIAALRNGEMDLAGIPFEDVDLLSDIEGVRIESVQTPGVVYLGFDCRVNDSYGYPNTKNPVSDVRVRKAMYHAIDVDKLIEKQGNISAGIVISQFVSSHTFGYNPEIQRLDYNVTRARMLLQDAGYAEGFTIVLDSADSNRSRDIVGMIRDELAVVNITVIANFLPFQEQLEKLYFKNTSLYLTGFSPLTAEGTILYLLHTSDMEQGFGVWNYGNYSNPVVDELYALMSTEMRDSVRKEYIQEAFAVAMEDVAWVPLYSVKAFYGVNEDLIWHPRPSSYILVNEIRYRDS